jgi:hypothetical protein
VGRTDRERTIVLGQFALGLTHHQFGVSKNGIIWSIIDEKKPPMRWTPEPAKYLFLSNPLLRGTLTDTTG